jgi:hypothetical protein
MNDTLQLIHSHPTASAHQIHAALTACLEALRQTGQHAAEVQLAQSALQELGRLDAGDRLELILGRLFQLGYNLEDTLFRVTFEDFASILLSTLDEHEQGIDVFSAEILDALVTETCDHLNSTGLDWRSAVRQGIEKGWPR